MITIDGFVIDANINEDHSFVNEVTVHEVEQGADIADHVRARPTVITVDSIVSDTPLGSIIDERDPGSKPSQDAYLFLRDLRDAREAVTIETSLDRFDDMMLTTLIPRQDARTGDSFQFTATFTQIRLVTNERTTIRVSVPRAARKVNRGHKTSPEPPTVSFGTVTRQQTLEDGVTRTQTI